MLSKKFRVAYLVYMNGATFKEVGKAVGVSASRAQTIIQVCDRRLEISARGAERQLWRASPQVWYHRGALGLYQELPSTTWERVAEPADRRLGDEEARRVWRDKEKDRKRRKMLRRNQLAVTLKTVCFCRQDPAAGAWVSWCPVLDLRSQGTTAPEAEDALRAALDTWVRLMSTRGVLFSALYELGLRPSSFDDAIAIEPPPSWARSFEVSLPLTFVKTSPGASNVTGR